MYIRMSDVLLFGGNVLIFRNYRSSGFYKHFGMYKTEKRCSGAHILGDRLINISWLAIIILSKFFDFLIVGVDCSFCTWSHSMIHTNTHTHTHTYTHTNTLGKTTLDERSAVSRDLYQQHTISQEIGNHVHRRDSNPHSRQASGPRIMPWAARQRDRLSKRNMPLKSYSTICGLFKVFVEDIPLCLLR
jgi:hypothetical protein